MCIYIYVRCCISIYSSQSLPSFGLEPPPLSSPFSLLFFALENHKDNRYYTRNKRKGKVSMLYNRLFLCNKLSIHSPLLFSTRTLFCLLWLIFFILLQVNFSHSLVLFTKENREKWCCLSTTASDV